MGYADAIVREKGEKKILTVDIKEMILVKTSLTDRRGTSALRLTLLLTLLNFQLVVSVQPVIAASMTANTATLPLARHSSTAQANDEIVYGTKKSFCITFPAGTNTENLQPVGNPPDALKTVKGGACTLGGLNGFWVEATARMDTTCIGAADIIAQNPTTFQALATKRLKILRPTHTTSAILQDANNGLYRCNELPSPHVSPAQAANLESPGGGVLWGVTIHGEPDSNGNDPVFDSLFLHEIIATEAKADACRLGMIGGGGGIIKPGNLWPDLMAYCKHKEERIKYNWIVGCQTFLTQRFKLGQCVFPGSSITNPDPVTHTHTFQFLRYNNSRSDPPTSSPTFSYFE